MAMRFNWRYLLASTFTLGLYPRWVAKRDVKTRATVKNQELRALLGALGEKSNISGVQYTATRLKVMLVNRKLINHAALEKLTFVSGVFVSAHAVSLIVGSQAKGLATMLEIELNLH